MQSIKEKLEKSKPLFIYVSLFLVLIVVLGSIRLAILLGNQGLVKVAKAAFPTNLSGKEGGFVASKYGKSYYFPWCGAANRIKDSNLVWFQNRASAEAKGYKPAGNCHGLK